MMGSAGVGTGLTARVDSVATVVDSPEAARRGGHEVLSLLLMDARNRLLQLLQPNLSETAVLRLATRAGVFQEHWIGCHVQRQRGEACDPQAVRLAGIEPRAGGWVDDRGPLPDLASLHAYLAETLDVTLDLLAGTDDSDPALYVYRAALWHEDGLCQSLAEALRGQAPPPRPSRAALTFSPQRWVLGHPASGGFVPHAERGAHAVDVPGFEIDAQPVGWDAFAEFAEDGGYDRPEFWTEAGRSWLQHDGRRAPRHVAQLIGGVLLQCPAAQGGGLRRVPGHQPAHAISLHEAEAWCCWAGRRLPTEPEWEIAATTPGRGFAWGDVHEWVAGRARLLPGAGAPPSADDSASIEPGAAMGAPAGVATAVLKGASAATRRRWHQPKARRFMRADGGDACCGFRSCAL